MFFDDKKLMCKDCSEEFLFTAGEQDFFRAKGFTNEPMRCPECRNKRKQRAMELGLPSVTAPGVPPPVLREVTTIICAHCGKETTIPFRPQLARPLYCRECYSLAKTQNLLNPEPTLPPELSRLIERLGNQTEPEQARLDAALELVESEDKRAVGPLLQALDDENQKIVWAAIEALGQLGDEQVLTALEARRETATTANLEPTYRRAIERLKKRVKQPVS